jgi:hypothetical protein
MDAQRPKQPFGSHAFEPGSECVGLLYNRPSTCVVAQFARLVDPQIPVKDLYYRRSSSSDYIKVPKDDRIRSYCDPVSCRSRPYVLFNVVQWDKAGAGFDWVSISRLSLPDGAIAKLIDSDGLKLPNGCIRGWVNSILDVNDDGTVVTCRLALEFATQPQCSKVEYAIRDLDLITGEHTVLASLPGVFV